MNFLPGTIRATHIDIDGLSLPLDHVPTATPPAEGTKVILGIRPEHISLADDGPAPATIDAMTDFLEPMGADTLGWFSIARHRISVRLAPQRARTLSGPVRLALDLRHASLFDAASERRF